MVGNTPDDKPQIRLRINVIELGMPELKLEEAMCFIQKQLGVALSL